MTKKLISLALMALTAAPLTTGAALALPQLAQETPPRHRPADRETPAAPAPELRGLSGPYLAARQAAIENDYATAANYFLQAMAQDDTDAFLQDSALVALISAGPVRTPPACWGR